MRAFVLLMLFWVAACIPPAQDTGATVAPSDEPALPDPYVVGQEVPQDFHLVAEAEDGDLFGSAAVEQDAGASGGEAVQLGSDGEIDLMVQVPVTGVYAIVVVGRSPQGFGRKFNDLSVDGEEVARFETMESTQPYRHPTEWAWMPAGVNRVAIQADWGWALYDRVELQPVSSDYLGVSAEPVTPGATDGARRLVRYLADHYGVTTLAGQENADSIPSIEAITGRDPAVLSVDFMPYSPSRLFGQPPPEDGPAEDALRWAAQGGIVEVSWHWNAPSGLLDTTWVDDQGNVVDASWYKGFYAYATTFDLDKALSDPTSQEHADLLRDIDAIAVQLKKLDDAGVPVLWRPLHEAAGGWFWWGAHGPQAYLQLWALLYDRLTYTHGLRNLVWVWNGEGEDWYPGDDTVDVVSVDIYGPERSYSTFPSAFGHAKNYASTPKIVALSETGTVPDPDWEQGALVPWAWFNLWSGDDFVSNETWNAHDEMARVYANDRVITLDELPASWRR